jgi:hypothetical protein
LRRELFCLFFDQQLQEHAAPGIAARLCDTFPEQNQVLPVNEPLQSEAL